MMRVAARTLTVLTIALVGAAIAAGQTPGRGLGMSCVANAGTPSIERVEGLTESVGDRGLNCTGGTPTPAGQQTPIANISLYVNTNITSKLIGNGFTDA